MGVAVKNRNYNTQFKDVGGRLKLAAGDGDQTLVACPNAYFSIFIQKIRVNVTTDAAQSCSFEDTASTPKKLAQVIASPGLGYQEWDYGPMGFQLTEAKDFVANVSAAGLAMEIEWEGYARATAASRPAGNRASGVSVA